MDKKAVITLKGKELLKSSLYNKGSAFSQEEREKYELEGLLPAHISTIEEQVERRKINFSYCSDGLSKYSFLTDLQNRNETLFYRFCLENISQTLRYIYTPVVGEASLNFSMQYTYSRGVYISYDVKDKIEKLLRQVQKKDIKVIVATDGGRVLGLGDVGVGGMTISIGKTSLYTLFGGVAPEHVLPVFLDVGTDTEELLNDPLYLGRRKNRIAGKEYFNFLDLFVSAVKKVYPKAMLQWEDLLGIHAQKVLDRYQNKILSFNDDIQGTAAVVLAGLLTALQLKESSLSEEKIAIFGGGAAGLGTANMLYRYLVFKGVDKKVARDNIYIIDRYGLTYKKQKGLREEHEFFAKEKPEKFGKEITLEETIKHFKITTLLGASAQKNAFTKKAIQEMSKNTESPIIFPLSNPDTKAEATPEMILEATKGKAVIATGTAFPDVIYGGKTYHIGQCNNVYIFPSIGLFINAFSIKTIPEEFFYIAGEALSKISPPLLFPNFEDLPKASQLIALELAKYASRKKIIKPMSDEVLQKTIENSVWIPKYKSYI